LCIFVFAFTSQLVGWFLKLKTMCFYQQHETMTHAPLVQTSSEFDSIGLDWNLVEFNRVNPDRNSTEFGLVVPGWVRPIADLVMIEI